MSIATDSSFNPRTMVSREGVTHTSPADVAAIVHRAEIAAVTLAVTSPHERSLWLHAVADSLDEHREELVLLADDETGLGLPRLRGEIATAATSARFYARVAVDGHYLAASAERVNESVTLTRWNIPVGPVAVFGASNFPFGFGVFGHDVASAIAAGCPVVVKAHPAHPRLSLRLADIARESLALAGAPDGVYELVVGFDAGLQLVDAPQIMAVAFTGSQLGGMALLERAAARGVPVFAEMGTVNPVFVTAAAVGTPQKTAEIAAGFVASFTLGAGQFCTKPGVLFVPAGHGVLAAVTDLVAAVVPAPLLTAGIAGHFLQGVRELAAAISSQKAALESSVAPVAPTDYPQPRVFAVTTDDLRPGSRLLGECFGPVALVCEYAESADALRALGRLQDSLVASVFTGGADDADASSVVGQLIASAGRVAVNAWPTGVANSWSQQHGGPWPATSRPQATSVGAGALDRFVRPVSVQNAEPSMLPAAFAPDNPWRIPRRIDGVFTLPPIHPTVPESDANA